MRGAVWPTDRLFGLEMFHHLLHGFFLGGGLHFRLLNYSIKSPLLMFKIENIPFLPFPMHLRLTYFSYFSSFHIQYDIDSSQTYKTGKISPTYNSIDYIVY